MYILYGIKNCNTVKKVVDYLTIRKVPFEFHDYKKLGIDKKHLENWIKQTGWESLVNKRGTTWRELPKNIKEKITNKKAAIELMIDKTSVIKRPLIEKEGVVISLGFDETKFDEMNW